MNIKISLRLYFLSAMLVLGIGMVIGFSSLSARYFIEGIDLALKGTMHSIAQGVEVKAGQTKSIAGFTFASRWQDLPQAIQDNIDTPPDKLTPYKKYVVQSSLLPRPSEVYFTAYIEDKNIEHKNGMKNTSQPSGIFISKVILQGEMPQAESDWQHIINHQLFWIAILGLVVATIFTSILLLMMRSVTKPVESLIHWARGLNQENLEEAPPSFRFKELDVLARLVRQSLIKVREGLNREHHFLRHASHELRTPIAVVGNNIELLKKIKAKEDTHLSEDESAKISIKKDEIVNRIERASLTMKNLTETLLWLSREEQIELPSENVELSDLLLQLKEDHHYLLRDKNITTAITTTPCTLNVPRTACRIILSNLIRNAYVHTQEGEVVIEQNNETVCIINTYVADNKSVNSEEFSAKLVNEELGFGLGLKLTEQLIEKFNWTIHYYYENNRVTAEVVFKES